MLKNPGESLNKKFLKKKKKGNFSEESNINKTSVWLIRKGQGHSKSTGRVPIERHYSKKCYMIYLLKLNSHLSCKMDCVHAKFQASSQGEGKPWG